MATTKSTTTTTSSLTSVSTPAQSVTNAVDTPSQSLQNFNLLDLQQYTLEDSYSADASKDFHLFYVGRDDVHNILKHVLSRASISIYLNMFGYDDQELNDIIIAKALDPNVTMLVTLDKSQSGGKTEKALIAADEAHNLAAFNTHFVIGESATDQISHTKGFVADGKVGAEGSTNWSKAGEGIYAAPGQQGAGYKAQNNTQSIFVDGNSVSMFTAELIKEHLIAQKQGNNTTNKQLVPKTDAEKATVTAAAVKTAAAHKTTTIKKAAAKKTATPKKVAAKKAVAPKKVAVKKATPKKAATKKTAPGR